MVHNKKKKENEKNSDEDAAAQRQKIRGKFGQTGNSGRMFYNEFNIQVHFKNRVSRGVVNSKSNNVPNRFRFSLMEFSIFI